MKVDSSSKNGQVVGTAPAKMSRAPRSQAADGVNSFIAQQAGIRSKRAEETPAVGVKSVTALPEKVLEVASMCAITAVFAMVGEAAHENDVTLVCSPVTVGDDR